jgi:hypothetical protein
MIGYTVGTKTYMLWDPRKKKIVISHNVLFDEQPLVLPSGTPRTDLTGFDVQDAALPEGVTQVRDGWDKSDNSAPNNTISLKPSISEDDSPPSLPPLHHAPSPSLDTFSDDEDPHSPLHAPH